VILTNEGPGFGFGAGVEVFKGGSVYPLLRSVGRFREGRALRHNFPFADSRKKKLLAICFTQKMISNAMVTAGLTPDRAGQQLLGIIRTAGIPGFTLSNK